MASVHERQEALAVITRYLPALRARLAFKRTQRAALMLQAAWRLQLERRKQAAQVLQAAVRGWLVRRRVQHMVAGVTRLQVGADGATAGGGNGSVQMLQCCPF